MSPTCLVDCAQEELQEYQQARVPDHLTLRALQLLISSWTKPPSGWLKLNWDAATDQSQNLMGA
jgi:hypothetical protein